jgi:abhydrolase domain-containing protein 12
MLRFVLKRQYCIYMLTLPDSDAVLSSSIMAPHTSRWTVPLVAGLAAPLGLYIVFICLGAFPFFQRQYGITRAPSLPCTYSLQPSLQAFYTPTRSTRSSGTTLTSQSTGALQVSFPHPLLVWCSPKLTTPPSEGNQVTPFSLETTDGETLYAWHVLPLPAYLKNEERLQAQPAGFAKDFSATESFRMLRDDPDARLVIVCKEFSPPHLACHSR